jgi:hypothetical protein
MAIPVYTNSPLGLIPAIETGNFKYGSEQSGQSSIFSSKHIIRKNEARKGFNPFGQNPLEFGAPNTLHNNDVYNISTSNIIEKLNDIPSMRLKWSDFAYCRDYGVYPNNRLIICRRFNNPVLDDLTFYGLDTTEKTAIEPISTLITWFDDQSEVLTFDFGEKWIDAEASFTEILNQVGNDIGLGKAGPGIKLGDQVAGGLQAVPFPGASEILQRRILKSLGIIDETSSSSEIIPSGTPNLIKQARQRELVKDGTPGSSLTGKFKVTVKCAWEQKFISGVDPTFIYYDILRTILSFGGSDAVFYLGKKSNLGKLDQFFQNYIKEGPIEQIKKVLTALKIQVEKAVETIKTTINNIKEGLEKTIKEAENPPSSENKEENDKENQDAANKEKATEADANLGVIGQTLNLVKNFIQSFVDTLIKKYRVAILGVVSALTGLPSTPWHVTIGNPLRPILSSGDMECSDVNIKLGPQLSFNDLPSYIECSFTLTSARNLGIDEIFEKLSNSGLRVSEEAPSFWNTEASSNTVYSIDPTTGVAATQSGTQSSGQTVFSDFSENVSAALGTQSKVGSENQGTSVNPDANSFTPFQ